MTISLCTRRKGMAFPVGVYRLNVMSAVADRFHLSKHIQAPSPCTHSPPMHERSLYQSQTHLNDQTNWIAHPTHIPTGFLQDASPLARAYPPRARPSTALPHVIRDNKKIKWRTSGFLVVLPIEISVNLFFGASALPHSCVAAPWHCDAVPASQDESESNVGPKTHQRGVL